MGKIISAFSFYQIDDNSWHCELREKRNLQFFFYSPEKIDFGIQFFQISSLPSDNNIFSDIIVSTFLADIIKIIQYPCCSYLIC